MKFKKMNDGRWLADILAYGQGSRLICESRRDAKGVVNEARIELEAKRAGNSNAPTRAQHR